MGCDGRADERAMPLDCEQATQFGRHVHMFPVCVAPDSASHGVLAHVGT